MNEEDRSTKQDTTSTESKQLLLDAVDEIFADHNAEDAIADIERVDPERARSMRLSIVAAAQRLGIAQEAAEHILSTYYDERFGVDDPSLCSSGACRQAQELYAAERISAADYDRGLCAHHKRLSRCVSSPAIASEADELRERFDRLEAEQDQHERLR